MAELTTKRRKALDDSEFAGKDRTYPIDTRARASNAKGRALQQLKLHNIDVAEYKSIVAKAEAKLNESKKTS